MKNKPTPELRKLRATMAIAIVNADEMIAAMQGLRDCAKRVVDQIDAHGTVVDKELLLHLDAVVERVTKLGNKLS